MFKNDAEPKCYENVKIFNCIALVRRRGSSWLRPGEFIRHGDCISGEGGGNSYHSFQVNSVIHFEYFSPTQTFEQKKRNFRSIFTIKVLLSLVISNERFTFKKNLFKKKKKIPN